MAFLALLAVGFYCLCRAESVRPVDAADGHRSLPARMFVAAGNGYWERISTSSRPKRTTTGRARPSRDGSRSGSGALGYMATDRSSASGVDQFDVAEGHSRVLAARQQWD